MSVLQVWIFLLFFRKGVNLDIIILKLSFGVYLD